MGEFKPPMMSTPEPPPPKKKRRQSNNQQANQNPPPIMQDLLPPPLTGKLNPFRVNPYPNEQRSHFKFKHLALCLSRCHPQNNFVFTIFISNKVSELNNKLETCVQVVKCEYVGYLVCHLIVMPAFRLIKMKSKPPMTQDPIYLFRYPELNYNLIHGNNL